MYSVATEIPVGFHDEGGTWMGEGVSGPPIPMLLSQAIKVQQKQKGEDIIITRRL